MYFSVQMLRGETVRILMFQPFCKHLFLFWLTGFSPNYSYIWKLTVDFLQCLCT